MISPVSRFGSMVAIATSTLSAASPSCLKAFFTSANVVGHTSGQLVYPK